MTCKDVIRVQDAAGSLFRGCRKGKKAIAQTMLLMDPGEVQDLGFQVPWDDMKKLHDLLTARPDLCERLNSAQPPEKPNYKAAAVDPKANKNPEALIDQKVLILSTALIQCFPRPV